MGSASKSLALLIITLFLASLVTIPSAISAGGETASSWNIQTVDNDAYTLEGRCPIVLDSNNSPHIAYTNVRVEPDRFQTPLVMYADWNGSGWSTQQIAEGFAHSLVLDASDNPHILYSSSWKPLMYASWTGSKWSLQTVDPNYFTGGGFGIVALDSYGNPHVAYTDGTTIKYAVSKGSGWSIQTVDTYEGEIPSRLSFALDKNNTPYIIYSRSPYEDYSQTVGIMAINVTLATYQNYSWKIQSLSLPPPIGNYGNLVVDSKGYPHFICTQNHFVSSENKTTLITILYASWNGSTWNSQSVVSDVRLGSINLALDANDYPHISYIRTFYDEERGDEYFLMYASWKGAAWDTQTVATSFFAAHPLEPYLAVDSNNNPHISYLVQSVTASTSLRYATIIETTPIYTPPPTAPISASIAQILPIIATIIVLVVAVVTLLLYRRHRKTAKLSK